MKAIRNFLIITFALVVFLTCLASLLVNTNIFANSNNVSIGILQDIAQTVSETNKLDPDNYLELEKIYELKQAISRSELTSVLFTIFSIVIITIGVFFMNLVNRTYDRMEERIAEIKNTIVEAENSVLALKKQSYENDINKKVNQSTSLIQRLQFTLMSYRLMKDNDPALIEELLPLIRDQLTEIDQSCDDISSANCLPSIHETSSLVLEISYCKLVATRLGEINLLPKKTLLSSIQNVEKKIKSLKNVDSK